MSRRVEPRLSEAIPTAMASRMVELGLLLWRLNDRGDVLYEPELEGTAGLWVKSRRVVELLGEAVRAWNQQEKPEAIALLPGLWALPVPEVARRKRVGYAVGLALGDELVETREFASICEQVSLKAHVAAHAVKQFAGFGEDEIKRLHAMVLWGTEDQRALAREMDTREGFTQQLSDAYETINALYAVGRSMSDLENPDRFVRETLEKLFGTLPFGWILVRVADDERLTAPVRGRTFLVGAHGLSQEGFEGALAVLEEACIDAGESAGSVLLDPSRALPGVLGPQVVVRPIRHGEKAFGLIAAGGKDGVDPQVSSYETLLLEAASGYLMSFLENVALYAEQQATFLGTIQAMTAAIDAKDSYTRGHSERVAWLSAQLARAAGLRVGQVERVRLAGLVHDVGKIGVPERVLCKPGRLGDDEFALIKMHPEIGYTILKGIPSLRDLLPGVLYHHERWDGTGYPEGLAGDRIPLMARIIGLADTFDAMSSNRAYRPAMPRERVLAEIRRCAGTQFDPDLAPVFTSMDFTGFDELVAAHKSQTAVSDAA
jgi:HD-GYP domain-containing protein (c-di-GMP phosphodiesterase class II)